MNSITPFLAPAAVLCGLMAIVSALRYKSRGPSAWVLAVAFLVLGACFLLVEFRAPLVYLGLGGLALVGLLMAEFALRSAQRGDPKP